MIKLLLTFKFLTVRRKAIKSVLAVFNSEEVEEIEEEEEEEEEEVLSGIIIGIAIGRSSVVAVVARVVERVFTFVEVDILIGTMRRLIDFFLSSL